MAENATKCSAADGVTQTFDFCNGTPLMVRAVDFNALHAECQRLRKDAERYRWLRDQHTYDGEGDCCDMARWYVQAGREPVPCDPGALDSEIDAAMAERAAVGAA